MRVEGAGAGRGALAPAPRPGGSPRTATRGPASGSSSGAGGGGVGAGGDRRERAAGARGVAARGEAAWHQTVRAPGARRPPLRTDAPAYRRFASGTSRGGGVARAGAAGAVGRLVRRRASCPGGVAALARRLPAARPPGARVSCRCRSVSRVSSYRCLRAVARGRPRAAGQTAGRWSPRLDLAGPDVLPAGAAERFPGAFGEPPGGGDGVGVVGVRSMSAAWRSGGDRRSSGQLRADSPRRSRG